MQKHSKQAFTLVELIVVITILAILGTIGFLSLQGYSKSARDSRRVSDIQNIKKSLELFTLNTSKYPLPDNSGEVFYSGSLLWTQGTLGDTVTQNLSRNLNSKPLDPLFETEYSYSVTNKQKEFELFSLYETEQVSINILNKTYAAGEYTVRIDGNYNQIFIQTDNYLVPSPSIVTAETLPLDFETTPLAIQSQVIDNGTNIPLINGSDIETQTGQLADVTLDVYEGIITNDTQRKEALEAIQNTYSGTTLATNDIYENILSAETETEKIALFEVVVEKKIPTIKSEEEIVEDTGSTLLNGLVSYYNFEDNNISDTLGNNDGSNNLTTDVDGVIGRGRSFNGSNNYISMSSLSSLTFTGITINMWVKPDSNSGIHRIVTKESTDNGNQYYALATIDSNFYWGFGGGSSVISPLVVGQLQHVVGTYDGITQKIYINGIEKASESITPVTIPNSEPLRVGRFDSQYGQYFDGILDEFGIWNRALTQEEVTELYNSGTGNQHPFTPSTLLDDIVSYWKGDTNGSFQDISGINDGIINGATYTSNGKILGAYNFDGVDDYIETQPLSITSNDITIGLWVKPGSTQVSYADIFDHNHGGSVGETFENGGIGAIQQNDNNTNQYYYAYRSEGATWEGLNIISTLTSGVWQHFLIIKSGITITHYINGVQSTQGTVSNEILLDNYQPIRFGESVSFAHDRPFNGEIDEPGIWDRALTQEEVTELYNSGTGKQYPFN